MSDQLITLIFEKLFYFEDPITKQQLNKENNDLNVICKDGHVNISLNIDSDNRSI